jgi:tetratricopeptide (TPR) repeat protein
MKKLLLVLILNFGVNSFGQSAQEYYNNGLSKSKSTDYQGAIVDYSKAIAKNPKYFEAYNSRGNAKNSLHDANGAILDLNKSIALNPEYGIAYYNRGVAKFNLNQRKSACLDWKKGQELGELDANEFIIKYCK